MSDVQNKLILPNLGCLINGEWLTNGGTFKVIDKFNFEVLAEVTRADHEMVSKAVAVAKQAVKKGSVPPADRASVLRRAAVLLAERRAQFVTTMVAEAGFTMADASSELDRSIVTLNLSAEEATRIVGNVVPFQASPGAHRRFGYTQRFPVGIVCAITPFNSPLNTVLHKIAPAYAGGNAVILKPSALTPLTSALLGQLFLDAGVEPAFLAIIQGDGDSTGQALLEEQDVNFYTFTGSTRVGRIIQQAAGLRRTQMELGSIASTIVCEDADIGAAIPKIANAGLRKAGQVCTSVQRVFVHRSIMDEVVTRLVDFQKTLTPGNPRDEATRVGPMISEQAAMRVESWVAEAQAAGAIVHCGGKRVGAVMEPTILTNVPQEAKAWCQEVFGPIISLKAFDDFEAAVEEANDTPYGLSVGVFTKNIDRAMIATQRLQFGTVQINETSSSRSDVMPFGGVKDSGFGKEGPAYSIIEMTEERLVIFNP